VNADELDQLLAVVLDALDTVVEEDWSKPAGTLEWTCWQTLDHTVDASSRTRCRSQREPIRGSCRSVSFMQTQPLRPKIF
jgi:hypothetical protein